MNNNVRGTLYCRKHKFSYLDDEVCDHCVAEKYNSKRSSGSGRTRHRKYDMVDEMSEEDELALFPMYGKDRY